MDILKFIKLKRKIKKSYKLKILFLKKNQKKRQNKLKFKFNWENKELKKNKWIRKKINFYSKWKGNNKFIIKSTFMYLNKIKRKKWKTKTWIYFIIFNSFFKNN